MNYRLSTSSALQELASAPSSFRWLRLEYGEVLAPLVHPSKSLMVLYAGNGTIIGDLEGPLATDDVVILPAGCKYGVIGGPNGLQALSIQLGEGADAQQESGAELRDAEHGLNGLNANSQRRFRFREGSKQ